MKDYRLELKIKNNYLASMMESRGIDTAAELSRASGVNQSEIGKILNLKSPAFNKDGSISKAVSELCDFFMCGPEDIFPERHLNETLPHNRAMAMVDAEDVMPSYLQRDAEDPLLVIENESMKRIVSRHLDALTRREKSIIEMRFGFGNDGIGLTHNQVGEKLGITRGRVQAIEARALRKLRTPGIVKKLATEIEY